MNVIEIQNFEDMSSNLENGSAVSQEVLFFKTA